MLYDKLKNYSKSGIYPFHMPGHKRTDITEEGIIPYNIDITEIHDFDNLHSPNGVIDEIQKKAAKLYNAKNAFILINGSTGGILSAIRSMTNQGDKILMARNCHKSVYNSAELFNLNVDYIFPDTDSRYNILTSVSPCDIEDKLTKHNDEIRLVIITSPTYEGVVSDIKSISEICHKHGAKLLVDEAHGAHFPFSDSFPDEALNCGADAAVLSLHKTLPSLTQTALLITNDSELSEILAENLAVFETSSPSYILMSSIEKCLDFCENTLALEPFGDKWRAFGWNVIETDGNDVDAVEKALRQAQENRGSGRPTVVIAVTTKGKGVSFMENDILWHYRTPQGEEYDAALAELEAQRP